MIPLKAYIPTTSFPLLTVLLIMLNVLIFIIDRGSGHYEKILVDTGYGMVSTVTFVGGLSDILALVPASLSSNLTLEWPTLFTSMFLHGNWLHVGSNMLYLWIFGHNIEDRFGRLRFLMFYFVCGLTAAIAQVASDPASTVPMVGASGAVAGIMGAFLLLYPQSRILTLVPIFFFLTTMELPAFLIIGYWVLLQFLNAALLEGGGMLRGGGVAYFAHIGGFLAGVTLLAIFSSARHQHSPRA